MNIGEYKALLLQRLEKYFNVKEKSSYSGKNYDIVADFSAREQQTVLFKENVMDYFTSKEICLVSFSASTDFVKKELSELPHITESTAEPSRHHKSTVATRVFVSDCGAEKNVVKAVRHFKFGKAFRFYFWGFAESKVVLVDLASGKVYSNAAARLEKKIFTPALTERKSYKSFFSFRGKR